MNIKKQLHYENIHSLKSLYFIVCEVDGYSEEKMEITTQFLLPQIITKKYSGNTQIFGMGLRA